MQCWLRGGGDPDNVDKSGEARDAHRVFLQGVHLIMKSNRILSFTLPPPLHALSSHLCVCVGGGGESRMRGHNAAYITIHIVYAHMLYNGISNARVIWHNIGVTPVIISPLERVLKLEIQKNL